MKNLMIITSLIFSLNALAKTGDEVRNGGGIVEQTFMYALKTLPAAIDRCLMSIKCAREDSQKELLIKIKNSHKFELEAGVLKFYSLPPHADFFMIDGVERIAITGSFVGSPIYYNSRMLYRFGDARIGVGQAIQSLIHELGHHHGATDHDALDLLGSEVRQSTEVILMDLPYYVQLKKSPFKTTAMRVLAIGRQSLDYNDAGELQLLLNSTTIDITHHFQPILKKCDSSPELPIMYSSMQFFNLHWDLKENEINSVEKFLSGNINLYCRSKYSRTHKKTFKFDLKIKLAAPGEYVFQSSELLSEPKYLFTEQLKLLRER